MPRRSQSLHRRHRLRAQEYRPGGGLRNRCSVPSWDSCEKWSVPVCWYRIPRTCRRSDNCASSRFPAIRTPASRPDSQDGTKLRGRQTDGDSIRSVAAAAEPLESFGPDSGTQATGRYSSATECMTSAGSAVSSKYSTPCFPPPINRVVPGISTGPEPPRSRSLISSPSTPNSSQLAGRNHPVSFRPFAGSNWINDSFTSNNW